MHPKTPTKIRNMQQSCQFFYGENLPMVSGWTKTNNMTQESHPFSNILDKLKKITTKWSQPYLNWMLGEYHHWSHDKKLVPTIFPQQQTYIQAWNILSVNIQSSIIHLNMYKEITPMDKYKQLHVKFGQEMDISISIKTNIQCDKLCQHLIGTDKPSPST